MEEHPDIRQFDGFATKEGGYEPVFNRNYAAAYELFSMGLSSVVDQLQKPLKVLDIGCGDGWTAAFLASLGVGTYVGIDVSRESVKALTTRMQGDRRLKVYGLCESAEWLWAASAASHVERLLGGFPSLIVCNTVIHQLRKTRCDIAQLIHCCAAMLETGGCFVVGDYYYPGNISEDELGMAQQWIRETTGQNPTVQELFLSPVNVLKVLRMTDLKVSLCSETQANSAIPPHYYLISAWRRM